jgi:transposase
MGQLAADQNALFYDFNLEQRIPDNHLLRKIDQFLDFDQIRSHLHSFYSHTGRPSVDPGRFKPCWFELICVVGVRFTVP